MHDRAVTEATVPSRTIAVDVRRGLTRLEKELPSKYFYDARGSRLFERICELPEYYPTRTELALLARSAGELVAACEPGELVELGPGSTRKARLLLDTLARGRAARYVPIDVSRSMVEAAARTLERDYEGLSVHGIVGDFLGDLDAVPRSRGGRLVAFLGSTIGNLGDAQCQELLSRVRRLLGEGDRFLLGTDLVKDRSTLVPAYDDALGITAEFNRNILRVVSRELDGDLVPERFDHVATWNEPLSRIELRLRARVAHRARLSAIGLDVAFSEGETILTEISRKWTRASVTALLAGSGLELERWLTDEREWFGLSLAKRA